MDVEGAEHDALIGARETLIRHHPPILLSVHSESRPERCAALLVSLGYRIENTEKPNPIIARA